MAENMFFCNPVWHDGEKLPADYRVQALKAVLLANQFVNFTDGEGRKVSTKAVFVQDMKIGGVGFSCCKHHVSAAVNHVMTNFPTEDVLVRRIEL